MDQRADYIRQDIESTRASLDRKLDTLESKARETFDLKHQVSERPWMALGAATKPGITFREGKVVEHNFYDNPLVRINEVPEIEVYILTEGGKIKGVGEPGLPAFAPALANAIFAATGKRIRKMPFDINKV